MNETNTGEIMHHENQLELPIEKHNVFEDGCPTENAKAEFEAKQKDQREELNQIVSNFFNEMKRFNGHVIVIADTKFNTINAMSGRPKELTTALYKGMKEYAPLREIVSIACLMDKIAPEIDNAISGFLKATEKEENQEAKNTDNNKTENE